MIATARERRWYVLLLFWLSGHCPIIKVLTVLSRGSSAGGPDPHLRTFSVIFAQNLDFVNNDDVQIQTSRKIELRTYVL